MKPKVAFFDFAGCEGINCKSLTSKKTYLHSRPSDVVSFREVIKTTATTMTSHLLKAPALGFKMKKD
jgi:hypothetical protein